jgi:hypothetical protein
MVAKEERTTEDFGDTTSDVVECSLLSGCARVTLTPGSSVPVPGPGSRGSPIRDTDRDKIPREGTRNGPVVDSISSITGIGSYDSCNQIVMRQAACRFSSGENAIIRISERPHG